MRWAIRPADGPAPRAPKRGGKHNRWSIPVVQPEPFDPSVDVVVVPRTAEVVSCPRCKGKRDVPACAVCGGSGRRPCPACASKPIVVAVSCDNCAGSGAIKCECADASGEHPCPTCRGAGAVHRYQEMTVTWTNWLAHNEVVCGEAPAELVDMSGAAEVLYQEQAPEVYEIPAGPPVLTRSAGTRVNQDVHEAINRLLADADSLPGNTRRRMQRVTVKGVPIYEGRYQLKALDAKFWILGRGTMVWAPDYPKSTARRVGFLVAMTTLLTAIIAGSVWWMYRGQLLDF